MLLIEERYYTVEQIAEMLQLGVETIRRKIRRGEIEGRRFGKEYRVSHTNLQKYLDHPTTETQEDTPEK